MGGELGEQAALPAPAKESHHVLDSEFRVRRQREASAQLPAPPAEIGRQVARTPLLASRLKSLRERSSKRVRAPGAPKQATQPSVAQEP